MLIIIFLFFLVLWQVLFQGGTGPVGEVTPPKNVTNPPVKRPRLNTSPSPNHNLVIPNSTIEDNRFKSPLLQSTPKSYKDLNENHMNKPDGLEFFKNYYGFPFDDSTLKMMSGNAKISKNCGAALKQKKSGLGSALPPGPFTPTLSLNPDLFSSLPTFPKTAADIFRYNDDPVEAQDLSKVRDLEHCDPADAAAVAAELGTESTGDPDLPALSASDSKPGNHFFHFCNIVWGIIQKRI